MAGTKNVTKNLKNFLSDIILSDLESITLGELKVLKAQINKKLTEIKKSVNEMSGKTDVEKCNDLILTTLTLKCVISLANKIERENETL